MLNRINLLRRGFFRELLSWILRIKLVKLGSGYAVMEMPVQFWFIVSENRIVQGGITAILADWAGVFAAMSSIEQGHTYLTELKLSYKKSFKRGETMIATARVIGTENRTVTTKVDVVNKSGELKSTGELTFLGPKPKTPQRRT